MLRKDFIEKPVIHYPQPKTYFISNLFFPQNKIKVNIHDVDNTSKNIKYINIGNLTFYSIEEKTLYYSAGANFVSVPIRALPNCDHFNSNLYPSYYYKDETFFGFETLDLTIKNGDVIKYIPSGKALPQQEKYRNQPIKIELEKLAGDIPVMVGDVPIVIADNRPSYAFLCNLYKKFIEFNPDNKLENQYKNTSGKCHLRASFVSILLDQYGIHHSKLFKIWNPDSWIGYNLKMWVFHCAVMIRTSENINVIYDPWVGLNHQLLTIPQWLNRIDEPKPLKFIVCNKATFTYTYGGILHEINQYSKKHQSKLHYLYENAVPNPPEKPLKLTKQNLTFFLTTQFQEKYKKENLDKESSLKFIPRCA